MKKTVDVAVSTDPISDFQSIVEYAKSMQGIADFLKNYNVEIVQTEYEF